MRNHIHRIPRKDLRSLTGSIVASLLMQQLDYWFARYPQGFYKFQNKTEHSAYQAGQSWCEEIGASMDEFRSAFDRIGVRYKSKGEFDEAMDKFQGKFYCCYFDRQTRLTYYFRNHDKLDQALDALISPMSSPASLPLPQQQPLRANNPQSQAAERLQQDSNFTINGESQFTVNGKFQVDQKNLPPTSRKNPLPTSGKSPPLLYTDNTNNKKQLLPPPLFDSSHCKTVPHENRRRSVSDSQHSLDSSALVFPSGILPEEGQHLLPLLKQCPAECRQAVLDEIEGAARRNKLRSGIVPFARYLFEAVHNGTFFPNLGVEVKANRQMALGVQKTLAALETQARNHTQKVMVDTLSEKTRKLFTPGILAKIDAHCKTAKQS